MVIINLVGDGSSPAVESSGASDLDSGMGSDESSDPGDPPGTEVIQWGDHSCRLPLELYELPDLLSILSVDTWNSILSEEDRFALTVYLPDSEDNETLSRTLTELLSGSSIHFGSPVANMFDRMKGGQFEPSVSLYRRGLKFFRRREHYFGLRRYQDSMVERLLGMRDALEKCDEYKVKERVRVLNYAIGRKHVETDSEDGGLRRKRISVVLKHSGRENPKVAAMKEKARPPTPQWNRYDDFELGTDRKSRYQMRGDDGDDDYGYDQPAEPREEVGGRRSWNTAHKNAIVNSSMLKSGKKPELMTGDERRKHAYLSEDYVGVSGSRRSRQMEPGVTIASYGRSSHDTAKKAHYHEKDLSYPVKSESRHRGDYDMQGEELYKSSMPNTSSDSRGKYNRSYLEQVGDSHFRYDPRAKTSDEKIKSSSVQKMRRSSEHSRGDNMFVQYEETESDSSDQVDHYNSLRKSDYSRDRSVRMERMKDGLHQSSPLVDLKVVGKGQENRSRIADTYFFEADPYEGPNMSKKRRAKAEPVYVDELDDSAYLHTDDQKMQIDHSDRPRNKGKWNTDSQTVSVADITPDLIISKKGIISTEREEVPAKTPFTLITPTIHTGFSFSIIHLLSAVRKAMVAGQIEDTIDSRNHFRKEYGTKEAHQSQSSENMDADYLDNARQKNLPSLTVHEIVNQVRLNPGDPCILETQEPLHDLVRGVLKILSSRTAPLGAKGWKTLVLYEKSNKSWTWIGPVSPSLSDNDTVEEETSCEAWGIPYKMLVKLVDAFANWLKSGQEILRQIGSLPPPPASVSQNLDETERFRDLKTQKCPSTISPSSDEARAYFHREEVLRYSIPDRAFSYTAADGKKSTVAPLRRGGGKPTSKARDHYILKTDRPPHVTILCLVRDAAARLPGSIGTRADISTLIRDSQYVAEDVSDAKVNAIVSGALDRLHYERDPCVQFDNDRKLWVYLHRDREEEDFDDDGTSSTKKWKKPRKHSIADSDTGVRDVDHPDYGDTEIVGYSAEYDYNHDSIADSTPIQGGQIEYIRVDLRHNGKNTGSLIDSTTRHKSHGMPVNPQGFRSNFLRESKMQCKENSNIEDFDEEPFGRKRLGR